MAYASPTRSFVVADPGYEAGAWAAEFVGAKVVKVPLRKDYTHDVQAMVQADPNAGVIYICNPNNPTGTVTSIEDIEYVLANKPRDAILILDEAYIHFSHSATMGSALVAADKDLIVIRTFSKLFGLAGLRAGAALGRPDLLEKLRGYGNGFLPAPAMAAAIASLKARDLVRTRRAVNARIREDVYEWMDKRGYAYIPSETNFFLVDVRRPGPEFAREMIKEKVAIGRTWPSRPNHVRVTVGTQDDMEKFMTAFDKVMTA